MSDPTVQIVEDLRKVLGDLAGQDLSTAGASTSFLEFGFDSLFLTQAATALKRHFGVRVTFRQLNEDLSSLQTLADYIAVQAPGAPVSANPPLTTLPNPAAVPGLPPPVPESDPERPRDAAQVAELPRYEASLPGGNALQRVVQEQLRVMEMQLALLRGRAVVTPGASGSGKASEAVARVPSAGPPQGFGRPTAASAPIGQHGPFRQVDRGPKGQLTPQQQAHLDWFIPRYVAKSAKSKEYTQRHRSHLADPRAVAGFNQQWKEMVYPIVATRSSGAYLWDLDGNRWLDVTMGFGVALLGHSPAFVTEAITRQLDLGIEIGPQSCLAGEVAELICGFTGMDRVTFCNTGSEAVMASLRICRTVTGRSKVVVFRGAYHGTFDEVLVRGATVNGDPKTFPIAPGIGANQISEIVVLDYGTGASLEWIRRHSHELAAVLVETVQSRHPDLQPVAFLREVRSVTRASDTPLIFDEVITGFRCHPGGAQACFGIEADLATYGKIIGGGMPFGFVAGKAWLMDAFDGGFWQYGDDSVPPAGVTFFAGTFVRHPLVMAAAKAMLLYLKEHGERLQATLAARTDRLVGTLNRYFEEHGVPVALEHFTSMWYPHFGAEVKHSALLYYHLREKGLHIWEGRPCFLSTAHSAEDEVLIECAFKTSVAEMQSGGFLAGTSDVQSTEEVNRCKTHAASVPNGAERPPGDAPGDADLDRSRMPATVSLATQEVELGGPLVPPPVAAPGRWLLTSGQREMWLGAQVCPAASGANNASTVIHLLGGLDCHVLQRAIALVIERYDALRCTFSEDGTEVVSSVSLPYALPVHDLSSLSPAERERRHTEILNREGQRIFDLAQGPLFSFQLVRLAPREHLLVFTVQMIACDGWSYNLILEDLGAIYSALVEDRRISLAVPRPMREYVEWQQQHQPEVEECRAYWISQFRTVPSPVDLPGFRPRPSLRTFEGARETLQLAPVLYGAIKRVASNLKSTPFALLLAAYQTWLYRLSGAEDLVIGVPFAGQSGAGLEAVAGQCVHTLPVRVVLAGEESFAELLRKTRSALLDAQEHWNFSFGQLVEKLDLPRDPSRLPLLTVAFNLDPPMSKVQFTGCTRHITSAPRFFFHYDLGFNLVDEGDSLLVECDYNSSLFQSDVIERWLGHFETLLESIVLDPNQPLGRLRLLDEAQQRRVIFDVNSTARDYSRDTTLDRLVSSQANRTPRTVAVDFEGQRLTYAEMEARANQLGNHLRALGVTPNTLVGLCLESSLDLVVGVLGVLKAGGAYVPLDPDAPRERTQMILEDTGAGVLVTHASLLPSLPKTRAHLVCLDEDWALIAQGSAAPPETLVGPEDLAYVLYTSGSTGKPKGVEIPHRAVVNFLESMRREPGLTAADVVPLLANPTFDIAGLEMLLPLIVGARVIILPRETTLDAGALSEAIERQGFTVMQATPATWRMLLDAGWRGRNGLRILCGGEALTAELADRLRGCADEVWNLYGPTETTVWSTLGRLEAGGPITLGHPIANTQVYVLDDRFQPVPVGVRGELVIGGLGVARGYHRDPDLTASKFRPDPFTEVPGARVFRTGDLARYLPDGGIEFLGRLDFQVKLRGHRIELGEIESALMGHGAVREAVVALREDCPGQGRLVAYIVTTPQQQDPATARDAGGLRSELRAFLSGKLPDYMIPSAFVLRESFARTANGKVDRASLPPPTEENLEVGRSFVAPRDGTEEKLARVWGEILKVPRVGARDNFFDLGGQSLLAAALFTRIEREFGRKLPLATLFRSPTVEQLAVVLRGGSAAPARWASLIPIQPKGTKPPLFLVHGAGGNVLLYRCLAEQLAPDYPVYGFQSQGLDGETTPLTTIEAMAALYLRELRTVQPKGPYHLGGYCLGGTVAYEMAQQLHCAGEAVRLVAMLDTYNYNLALKASFTGFLYQKLKFHAGNFMRLRPQEMGRYLGEKIRLARAGELAHLRTSMPGSTTAEGVSPAVSGVEASVQAVNDHAAEAYVPQPYPGRLTLFKPHVNYKFYPDPNMGWKDLALGGLEIVEMRVNPHAMLVEPFVRELAARLRLCLDEVDLPGSLSRHRWVNPEESEPLVHL